MVSDVFRSAWEKEVLNHGYWRLWTRVRRAKIETTNRPKPKSTREAGSEWLAGVNTFDAAVEIVTREAPATRLEATAIFNITNPITSSETPTD
jgi:hypothetical protein